MKKTNLFVLLLVSLFFIGCKNQVATDEVENSTNKIDSIEEINNKKGTLICTRNATATNASPFFKYTVTYSNDELLRLHSIEGITSSDEAILDEYEEAYKKISSYYENLKYYDVSVIRNDNTVTWDTNINYQKIDIDALLDLEGEENNIVKDGKASLSLWLEMAKKVGTTCIEE